MKEKAWLEYRLEALEFFNGAKIGFKNARMRYRDDNREILIERLGAPPWTVDRTLAAAGVADGKAQPIKTIYYEMRFAGFPREAFFFHPLARGANVFLEPRPTGQNVLFFKQAEGRPIFSKDWTAREVTQGRVADDRRVWQFHGYKHEH
jgi:hypothetical protein